MIYLLYGTSEFFLEVIIMSSKVFQQYCPRLTGNILRWAAEGMNWGEGPLKRELVAKATVAMASEEVDPNIFLRLEEEFGYVAEEEGVLTQSACSEIIHNLL